MLKKANIRWSINPCFVNLSANTIITIMRVLCLNKVRNMPSGLLSVFARRRKNRFFHYVAVPHAREEERPFYYIVSEDIFGEYDKGNIEVVTEIGGEKYKLINDFEGWGMLIPKWMFLERQNALSIYSVRISMYIACTMVLRIFRIYPHCWFFLGTAN